MGRRYALPSSAAAPQRRLLDRLRAFLFGSLAGRVFVAATVLHLLPVSLPGPLATLVSLVFYAFLAWFGFRLARALLRRLLWRIRTKLIVSYLFVAVVPVALLALFFVVGGLLFAGLVAGHMATAELARIGSALEAEARSGASALDAAALEARLLATRKVHPGLAFSLVREGRLVAAAGGAPRTLPAWLRGPAFSGIVRNSSLEAGAGDQRVLRAVFREGGSLLVLDVPLDDALADLVEQRTGIRLLLAAHGEVRSSERGLEVRVSGPSEGMTFVALADDTDWRTGEQAPDPIPLRVHPYELVRRLSAGSTLNLAEHLVTAMMVLGVTFLVIDGVAVLAGWFLARSVTRSVHALHQGTERIRQGDFSHQIAVRSRDQLGELAESFNVMTRGIQELLREQADKERLEEELRIARQIQMSLLPHATVGLPGVRIAALCVPAAEVGGDYYDLLPLSDTRMGLLVADVSGKGTSAALYMAELKGLVLSLSRIYVSPAKLLAEANRILAANLDSRSFVTMTYAVVDVAARSMRYARAGHNPILHLQARTGLTRVLMPPGLGLGLDRGARFEELLEEAEVALVSGDVFLFFTDGLSEAMNGASELFGERRLRDILEQSGSFDESAMKDRILEEIKRFVGEAAQHDDMTLVVLKVV